VAKIVSFLIKSNLI